MKKESQTPSWKDIDVLESFYKDLNSHVDLSDALTGEANISGAYLKHKLQVFTKIILRSAADD